MTKVKRKQSEIILTVDSGVRAMGVCAWETRTWFDRTIGPIDAQVFRSHQRDWWKAVSDIIRQIDRQYVKFRIAHVYAEEPHLFAGGKGYAAAASGDLIHLASSVGSLAEFAAKRRAKFSPVLVRDWVGNLPKKVVRQRIIKAFFDIRLSKNQSHDWDACGIGMFLKGHPYFD